jgi:hypothetical protein
MQHPNLWFEFPALHKPGVCLQELRRKVAHQFAAAFPLWA